MIFRRLFLFILLLVFFSFTGVFSKGVSVIELGKGKNFVQFNLSEGFYADTLIKLNPAIESISYRVGNRTIGYVNVFGGVGENFIINSNQTYEIVLRKNSTLILPETHGRGG